MCNYLSEYRSTGKQIKSEFNYTESDLFGFKFLFLSI